MDNDDFKKYSLKRRRPLTEEERYALFHKILSEKDIKPYFKILKFIEENYERIDPKKTTNELLKRYKYLYDNKELILALCIKDAIDYENIKESIKDLKKTLKKDNINEEEKKLLEYCLKRNKDILSGNKLEYYLFSKVDDEITDAYEEFLFTDNNIKTTKLYKHIEAVKCSKKYMASINNTIDNVEARRKYYNQIYDRETFTVWKILTYVREKNINNKKVLQALDKYYNLDRYITTGLNLESSYEFLDKDIDIIDYYYASEDYKQRIQKGPVVYGIIDAYKKLNKFEDEDEYYDSYIEYIDINPNPLYKTKFMQALGELPNLKEEDKKVLRDKLIEKGKIRIK